jgi:hypothetical protein
MPDISMCHEERRFVFDLYREIKHVETVKNLLNEILLTKED